MPIKTIRASKAIRPFAICAAIIATLMVIFVLSCGPVQYLAERDAFAPNTIATLDVAYKPLGRISESPSIVGKALRAYMRLWTKGTYFNEDRFEARRRDRERNEALRPTSVH